MSLSTDSSIAKMKNTHTNKPRILFILLPFLIIASSTVAQNETFQVKVGVVLDLETPVSRVWLSCISMALSDLYASNPRFKTRLLLRFRDSNEDVVDAASAALDLIKNEQVEAILGPQSSSQAKFMIELGQKSQVPILSFSATSPSLTSTTRSPYFFRAAIDDSSQVKAISSLVSAFKWREVVPIYVDNDYGHGIIPYLVDSLQAVDAHVPYRSVISPSATGDQIEKELYKLMTMQTRVFVVHVWYDLGARLFEKASEIGMMGKDFVWIVTNDFTDMFGSLSPSVIDSMQGVLGVKTYVPRTQKLRDFEVRWRSKIRREDPEILDQGNSLNAMSFRAYDSAFALALAVEKVSQNTTSDATFENGNSRSSSSSSVDSSDLDSLGVSRNGPRLVEALSGTRFNGVAGDFRLVNGQLELDTFKIVNVNGVGGRRIGYWTPENGLTRKLFSKSSNSTSESFSGVGPIIWPGESTAVPKGWEIPTNEKRLRIGVAVKDGFKEFVDVKRDKGSNTTQVTGFSIDVFEAAVKQLPYALPHEYIPFSHPNGSSAWTYDDLVYQVFLGNYDVVVSDTTIRANRSTFVDFTLPYTESGVVMVVPVKDNKRKSAWIFLEPLTWGLWLTSACFFVFIGFVVWVLEHRINPDFRGPPSHQVGTGFWFSFSTMVFAQKESVISNLARFVVIIWVFVVLILTQSYTASLTSLLTVEQLQPTVTDLNQLLKSSGDKVGYLESSFVYSLLRQSGFPDSRIVVYKSAEDCDQLLSKGSANGGISAAVDETPNMKLFLARFCSKYTTIGPIFKTAGFGFVFPKGSPLVAEISRAILNVTEGDEIRKIENKWFKLDQQPECRPDSQPKFSSDSLSLGSFWGLFLIAGVASLSSLLVFAAKFIHKHREILLDPKDSVIKRIEVAFKSFDQKDLSSHTFRKKEPKESTGTVNVDLQNSTCPPSPSSYSIDVTGPNSPAFLGEQSGPFSSGEASPEIVLLPANIELVVPDNIEAPRTTNGLTVNV